jgi:hypothetical protein
MEAVAAIIPKRGKRPQQANNLGKAASGRNCGARALEGEPEESA